MAVEMNFYLSDSDFNKLRLLKNADEEDSRTYDEYAEELLRNAIYRMYYEYRRSGMIGKEENE